MKLLPLLLTATTALAKPLPLDIVRNTATELDSVLIKGQQAQGIKANPLANDPTFLRRSYLNIIGRLPTHDEAKTFLESKEDAKRTQLIDSLVDSPGFDSRLFNFWSDLLRLQTRTEHHGLGWHVWLRNAVKDNMPYDDMVRDMLSAQGHIAENPAVGYYLRDRGMLLDNVSNTVEVFLGQQIGCAQCHDHPFEDTTQMEYYQLASFLGASDYNFEGGRAKIREFIKPEANPTIPARNFNQGNMTKAQLKEAKQRAKKKANEKAQNLRNQAKNLSAVFRYHQRNALSDKAGKKLKLPADYKYDDGKAGQVVQPGFLFGFETPDISPEKRRQYFADWVSSPENPYFTKVISNRLWEYVFGYGLVANPSDWGGSPDPHYPELVTYLEKAMLATEYDLKEFLRILFHTQLFQREVTTEAPSPGFSFHFQGPVLRRLDATEIRDSFLTLVHGNIDGDRNPSLEQSWDTYVESFDFVMGTNKKQFREINQSITDAEKQRRANQKAVSLLRTKIRLAKEKGDIATAQKIETKIRTTYKNKNYKAAQKALINENETLRKAYPVTTRQGPSSRVKGGKTPDFKLRSSELPTPQRGGTFVSEFGGSDAESPSSAHTAANVPQILRLLNGKEANLLIDNKNHFSRKLRTIDSPAQRLDFLFLSLYSAFPTEAEKEAFLPEVSTSESAHTFAKAIFTSNRFLFVQ